MEFLEEVGDAITDTIDSVTDGAGDAIASALEAVLNATIYKLLYYLDIGLCKIVGVLDEMFQVFAGINKVTYNGERDYLVNVFFTNSTVSNVYWGMALIGIAMCFMFAIIAVTRRLFDYSGSTQQSLGQIMTTLLRSIMTIVGMSAIMIIMLNATNILMQQINYIFNDARNLDIPETIVYTDEQYAAMGRVFNTIGNYSLNPSSVSRYNINICFNEIRGDLYDLQRQGVFRYYYETDKDADGNKRRSWQSQLQKIVNAAPSLRRDLKLDVPYNALSEAIQETMEIMRTDASFRPLEKFSRIAPNGMSVPMDRYVFLLGTMRAANQDEYNENPAFDDPLRGPYYTGEKDLYDLDTVTEDFSISLVDMDYIVVYFAAAALIIDLVIIILNCVARIFNMLFLYIISPPILAIQPLDNGGKTKQWMTAFIAQSFGVFGTVISMRLLLVYLPIIVDAKLVLFENVFVNFLAKLLLIYGGFETARKSNGILTGILTDSAGMQSTHAADMSSSAGSLVGGAARAALGVTKVGAKAGLKVAGFATKPATNLLKRPFAAAGRKWSSLGTGNRQREAKRSVQRQIAQGKAQESYLEKHPENRKYFDSPGQGSSGGSSDSGSNRALPPPPLPPSLSGKPGNGGAQPKPGNSAGDGQKPSSSWMNPNETNLHKLWNIDPSTTNKGKNNGANAPVNRMDPRETNMHKLFNVDPSTTNKGKNNGANAPQNQRNQSGQRAAKDAESLNPSRRMKLD